MKKLLTLLFIFEILSCNAYAKRYDMVVYTGRFQPFHEGHYNMMKESVKYGNNLLIVITQANGMIVDARNVFSGDDRYNMINDTLWHDKTINKYNIIKLDYFGSNDRLKSFDNALINASYREYKNIFGKYPKKENIAFIYYNRDKAKYEERLSGSFSIIEIKDSFSDDISATKIRNELFKNHKIDDKLPFGTKKFLQMIKN